MRLITLCLLATSAAAQVPIAQQPDLPALKAALLEARAKRPRESKALLAIKQGPVEPTLAADLSRYDWYLAGAWSYPEQKFGVTWDEEVPSQFQLNRYLADGGELSYSLDAKELTHTNFELPPRLSAAIRQVGKQTYFELTAYGEKELHRVVSYEKGVLILDLSYDGKPNSKKVKFRDVRIAVPRMFESSGK